MCHHDLHASLAPVKGFEEFALQLILDPIMTHFDVDAVFSGHSHRYVRTHVLRYGRLAQLVRGSEITDPRGAVYINNTSVVHVSGGTTAGFNLQNAFVYCEPSTVTYNVLTFEDGRFNVKACKVEDGPATMSSGS